MFINKAKDGLNNVCGKNVAFLRKNMGLSQRHLCTKRRKRRRFRTCRFLFRKSSHDIRLHSIPETDPAGCKRFL